MLKNRLWTSQKGKATAKKLDNIKLPQVEALDAFTLAETIKVLGANIKKANDGEAVAIMFLVPAADPAVNRNRAEERIVPPARWGSIQTRVFRSAHLVISFFLSRQNFQAVLKDLPDFLTTPFLNRHRCTGLMAF